MAQLTIGDRIPDFSLLDENKNVVSSSELMNNGPVVVYFYPKDDTPGCTKEACSFRDSYEEFTDKGVRVVGISSDSPESHLKFKEKYNLPFTLLADTDNTVRKAFGVKGDFFGLIPGRVTFIFNEDGIIQHVYDSQTRSENHVLESFQAIEGILKTDE